MKNFLLLLLITFSTFLCTSLNAEAHGSIKLSTSICQKACHNIFSLISLDLALLSPKASISDLSLCGPKTSCCNKKQIITPECKEDEKSSVDNDDEKESILPELRDKAMGPEIREKAIIPVAYKQESKQQPCATSKTKSSMFRVDLFRCLRLQIL